MYKNFFYSLGITDCFIWENPNPTRVRLQKYQRGEKKIISIDDLIACWCSLQRHPLPLKKQNPCVEGGKSLHKCTGWHLQVPKVFKLHWRGMSGVWNQLVEVTPKVVACKTSGWKKIWSDLGHGLSKKCPRPSGWQPPCIEHSKLKGLEKIKCPPLIKRSCTKMDVWDPTMYASTKPNARLKHGHQIEPLWRFDSCRCPMWHLRSMFN